MGDREAIDRIIETLPVHQGSEKEALNRPAPFVGVDISLVSIIFPR